MKKTIGICTTKLNDEFSRNFISCLREQEGLSEYSVAVFHSVFDFYDSTIEFGARSIFGMLPFDDLCAVIILRDAIFDNIILETIINGAAENNVPVIMARGQDERCISITGVFEEAYKELLNSVIKEQGIRDTFYIAGRKHDDPDSEHRLAVYREVLEENGIPFKQERVEYGEYWETPTNRAINKMLIKFPKPPEAIFCANDIMAFTVIERLKAIGVRVPEDTVVTGFDGLDSSKYCSPSVSSCCEDTASLAKAAANIIIKLSAGEKVGKLYHYSYRAAKRQSSERSGSVQAEELDTRIFFSMRADEINERLYNGWLDTVISVPNVENLRRNLPAITGSDYSVCLRADAFLDENADVEANSPSEFLIVRRDKNGGITESFSSAAEVTHNFLGSAPKDKIAFFSMISNSSLVYGIAFTPTADIQSDAIKINRYIRTLNRALYVALCGEKLKRSAGDKFKKKYIDALTGTLNIDGANKWFAESVINEFTRANHLSAGVYTYINYQKVLENCGTHVIEEDMQYIAKSLKLANPENTVIARISADSFAVLMLHSPDMDHASVVDNAVNLFYNSIELRNKTREKDTELEVSCGYHNVHHPWQGKLSEFLNAAISTLYRNRVSFDKNLPKSIEPGNGKQFLEYRSTFMTLLSEDLLTYHFQPIVDAKTGGIAAYEALMRTKGEITMSPLDILAAATMFSKLEQVEYMSFAHIFERMAADRDKFGERSVFINTIPGHFLPPELCDELYDRYGEFLSRSVIEITESETITLDELEAIRTFGGNKDNIRIAVDDYGTGHSNIVNLIEYKPQIVKVDRYLITNIQNDKNKQMFLRSIIEFSAENGIKVLAEGVETSEELETVIAFGVDYIQGYYTARPCAEVLERLPEDIERQIKECAEKQLRSSK